MKYLRLVLLLVFVVGVYISCKQDTSKDSMICLVKKWERKQILYPLESTFTIYGKDTLKNYEKSGIKLSAYNSCTNTLLNIKYHFIASKATLYCE